MTNGILSKESQIEVAELLESFEKTYGESCRDEFEKMIKDRPSYAEGKLERDGFGYKDQSVLWQWIGWFIAFRDGLADPADFSSGRQ